VPHPDFGDGVLSCCASGAARCKVLTFKEIKMPYGKCRNCIYCRTRKGVTFDEIVRALQCRFSVHEEQVEVLKEHYGNSIYCRRKTPIHIERVEGFPYLEMKRVALGELGCGEFELDPDALLDEYEQQQ
jgi:hypothetical protein